MVEWVYEIREAKGESHEDIIYWRNRYNQYCNYEEVSSKLEGCGYPFLIYIHINPPLQYAE